MAYNVSDMHLNQRRKSAVLDLQSSSPTAVDALDVDLDKKTDWEFWDTLPSDGIDFHSTLRAGFTDSLEKCAKYSAEAPKTSVDVFMLALRGFNTLVK